MNRTTLFFLLLTIPGFSQSTFTNPLLPSGADPWSIYKDGNYYYTNTLGDRIDIWKTKNLADLKAAERKTIWIPPVGTSYSKEIWAPEIHFIHGKWYVYFAADDGKNDNHRLYVLENESANPLEGEWMFKGKISYAVVSLKKKSSVFEHNHQLYMVWSGWEGDSNGRQDLYIAKLKNPWTVACDRVKISHPEHAWERHGDLNDPHNPPHVDVNEGPQVLVHRERVFIVYSASGCWTDFYALGVLMASADEDLMDAASWKKSAQPVFKQSLENKVFAPGHNSFFKSPDGKEDWILYHANGEPGQGCGKHRSPRAQKFTWNADGTPYFGEPVKEGMVLEVPADRK